MNNGVLESIVRSRVEEALANHRDPTTAAIAAFNEYQGNLTPNASNLLREVRRVEIHRGAAENHYRLLFQHEMDEAYIELTQKEIAKNADIFNERYLQHFNRLPRWGKGEWAGFVEAVLHHETAIIMEGREDATPEELAVEGFIERAQRWRPTRDIHQSVRDEDKVFWEDETGHLLVRSERVNRYLSSSGYASLVKLERFAALLKERGVVLRTSFQHRIPAPPGGKEQNLRMWRLSAGALGFTSADILPAATGELPPDPASDGTEDAA